MYNVHEYHLQIVLSLYFWIDNNNNTNNNIAFHHPFHLETDSESIETISEDEAQAFPTLPLASFCYVSGTNIIAGVMILILKPMNNDICEI